MSVNNFWSKISELDSIGILSTLQKLGGASYYLSPSGSDSNSGTIDSPCLTLEHGYSLLRSGMNDMLIIMPNWLTGLDDTAASCTIRLDAAFSWNKPATHLIGMNPAFADVLISPRARLAPTSTTTAFANFFTIPAGVSGCLFSGIQFVQDFGTDGDDQVCVTVTSSRNVFHKCHFYGNAKASDAGGRSLLITTSTGNKGENLFVECTIGVDTITRSAASALLGLSGSQSARNWFKNCQFLSAASSATALMIKADAGAIDRFVMFENCTFINFGTALTSLMSINSSQNGSVLMINPSRFNCGNFGNTANTLITGPVTVNTSGLGTAPAA